MCKVLNSDIKPDYYNNTNKLYLFYWIRFKYKKIENKF